jgi:hypothetical protein
MYYLSPYGDVSPLIQSYLQEDDILHTNHLLISRWLQVAPKNRAWRTSILRTLTSVLQKERESASLSAKIIAALAFAGDAGVSIYFKQLIRIIPYLNLLLLVKVSSVTKTHLTI